jgi:hypothetical protein
MKNCGSKIKHTCAEKNYATCIYYELDVPNFSSLFGEDCITIEETTNDVYEILEGILESINVSALDDNCVDYDTPLGQALKIKDVVLQLEQEVCDLRDKVTVLETTAICNADITHCTGLDLSGINNSCATPVTTLGELLDYLLNHTTP